MQDWGTLQLTRFASQSEYNGFDYRIDNHSVFTMKTRSVFSSTISKGKVFILKKLSTEVTIFLNRKTIFCVYVASVHFA